MVAPAGLEVAAVASAKVPNSEVSSDVRDSSKGLLQKSGGTAKQVSGGDMGQQVLE